MGRLCRKRKLPEDTGPSTETRNPQNSATLSAYRTSPVLIIAGVIPIPLLVKERKAVIKRVKMEDYGIAAIIKGNASRGRGTRELIKCVTFWVNHTHWDVDYMLGTVKWPRLFQVLPKLDGQVRDEVLHELPRECWRCPTLFLPLCKAEHCKIRARKQSRKADTKQYRWYDA